MRAFLHIVVHGKTKESVEKQIKDVILGYFQTDDEAILEKVDVEYHAMYTPEVPREWLPPEQAPDPKDLQWGFEARADVRIK